RQLGLLLIGVGKTHAGDRLRVRTGLPRAHDRIPHRWRMLHFGPGEVVAGVRHGAVGLWIGDADDSAADNLAALHQFDLGGIPELGSGWRIEGRTVFPLRGVEGALVHRALRGDVPGLAVLTGAWSQRKLVLRALLGA